MPALWGLKEVRVGRRCAREGALAKVLMHGLVDQSEVLCCPVLPCAIRLPLTPSDSLWPCPPPCHVSVFWMCLQYTKKDLGTGLQGLLAEQT